MSDEYTSYDGMAMLFTAEEALAFTELDNAGDKIEALLKRLPVDDGGLCSDLEAAIAWEIVCRAVLIHARLCRFLPHLTDLITMACYPDDMPTPGQLGPGGRPAYATQPIGALTSWRRKDDARQQRQAREERQG